MFDNYKYVVIFFACVLLVIITNLYRCDFIPIGIVEFKSGNYYIVDKLIYKVKTNNDSLKPGDILYFNKTATENNIDSQIEKNILYISNDYRKITSFSLRYHLYSYINSLDSEIKPYILKFIYNIYSDNSYNYAIGYGLMSYYFFNYLIKRNKIGIILLSIYSLLFGFQIKFYLIYISYILDLFDISFMDKTSVKIFLLVLINKKLLSNYSILISLLISLYKYVIDYLPFTSYISILNVCMFHELNPIKSITYGFFIKLQIIIFIFTFLFLIFPSVIPVYRFILHLYSFINEINISIRGNLSVFVIVLIVYFYRKYEINHYCLYIIICLLTVLPINNPFYHISFIDVGQGNATLIRNIFNGKCVLIDTGSEYNYSKLKNYLFSESIYKIDYLIVSHDDSDHNGNIDNLLKDFKIHEIVDKGKDINLDKIDLKYLDIGIYDNDNDNSLVYLLNIDSYNFLFTGDISSAVEKDLINRFGSMDIDVFLATHHGSHTGNSDYLIRNIMPRYAIISTSGMYNHPSLKTLETFDDYKVKYYITKENGTIRFDFTSFLDFITLYKKGFVIMIGK